MEARIEVMDLLRSVGASPIRDKNHIVWELPGGRRWVVPKTPSDLHAWKNNLSDLKRALGISDLTQKTHVDFEHKKKEAYVKSHHQPSDVWLGHPEAKEVLVAPETPDKDGRAKEQLERELEKAMPSVYAIGGVVPVKTERGGVRRTSGGKTSQAYTYSRAVMEHANYLLLTHGQKASNDYLYQIRTGQRLEVQYQTKQEEVMPVIEDQVTRPPVVEGGLEQELQKARERVRTWKAKVVEAQDELQRAELLVRALENAVGVSTASRSQIREMAGITNGNGATPPPMTEGYRGRGFWQQQITEIVGTSPISLTRKTLVEELKKANLSASDGAIYQAVRGALDKGYIFENDRNFIALRTITPASIESMGV